MKRRQFLLLNALAASNAAVAQQRRFRVAYLSPTPAASPGPANFQVLKTRLGELGYTENANIVFDTRWGENDHARLPALASELVALKPDVFIASATLAIRAAQRATTSIPIVMVPVTDPVGSGFIKSLARPGGNITGVANLSIDTSAKLLELLHELVPNGKRIGLLTMPVNPTHATHLAEGMRAAKLLGLTGLSHGVTSGEQIDLAFATFAREKYAGAVVFNDPLFSAERQRLVALATRHGLPVIYQSSANVDAGGLVSYGTNVSGMFRMAGDYVDKILKGRKPADLPVEQPTRLELVINAKVAKSLGLKIPQSIYLRADRVIE